MSKYIIDIPKTVGTLEKVGSVHYTYFDGIQCQTIVLKGDEIEELNSDYINEHFGDLQDTAYQRGLEDGKAVHDKGCEGCKYQANKELTCPCSECANNYKNQWTAKSPIDDGFVRGDVVVDENGTKGIVVSNDNNEDFSLYVLFGDHRIPQNVSKTWYKKTGEHYDIDKFLDEIKGDSDK